MITDRFRGRHVHLIGVGGSGVSALAPLLTKVGARVSGCDSGTGAMQERLQRQGYDIYHGHDPVHLDGVDLVVHTAAAKHDHPELVAARLRGIPVMTRGECLVELMVGTRTIAVAGSHGKTSTTWMLGHLLTEAGLDPVVMVGGSVASLDGGARVGSSEWFVAEADESDGSFARIRPEIAIITNLDQEHLSHYGSFAALEQQFHEWVSHIPKTGAVIVPVLGMSERLLGNLHCQVIRCGLDHGDVFCSQLELGADGSRAQVHAFGKNIGEISVPLPGAHMVLNALMAIAAAIKTGAPIHLQALANCERVRRRFTVHGRPRDIRVVEDYGHHPTEIRATIAAARLGSGRVHVIFQPHRYSRTAECFIDFISAFDQAYSLALLPIYAAGETALPDVSSSALGQAISEHWAGLSHNTIAVVDDAEQAIRFIADHVRPGDTCLLLGAGDVGQLAGPLIDFFHEPERESVPDYTHKTAQYTGAVG